MELEAFPFWIILSDDVNSEDLFFLHGKEDAFGGVLCDGLFGGVLTKFDEGYSAYGGQVHIGINV